MAQLRRIIPGTGVLDLPPMPENSLEACSRLFGKVTRPIYETKANKVLENGQFLMTYACDSFAVSSCTPGVAEPLKGRVCVLGDPVDKGDRCCKPTGVPGNSTH